jgi:hypothetical protein
MTPDDFVGFVRQGRERVAAIISERRIPIN